MRRHRSHQTGRLSKNRQYEQIEASIQSKLIGYWPMQETQGTRYDVGGHGLHLTDVNTVTYDAGQGNFPICAQFTSAAAERLMIADTDILRWQKPRSMCGWVKFKTNADFVIVCKYDGLDYKLSWLFTLEDSPNSFRFYNYNTAGILLYDSQFGVPPMNTWIFTAFGITNDDSKMWISTNARTWNTTAHTNGYAAAPGGYGDTANVTFGAYGAGVQPLNGYLAEWRLFDRSLEFCELSYLYNQGLGKLI